jgi:hypothetical protein
MQYFNDASKGYKFGAKSLLVGYADKCKVIIDNVRHRLNDDLLAEIDADLADTLVLESINQELVKMSNEQRQVLEKIVTLMAKGEEIKIVDDTVNTY